MGVVRQVSMTLHQTIQNALEIYTPASANKGQYVDTKVLACKMFTPINSAI